MKRRAGSRGRPQVTRQETVIAVVGTQGLAGYSNAWSRVSHPASGCGPGSLSCFDYFYQGLVTHLTIKTTGPGFGGMSREALGRKHYSWPGRFRRSLTELRLRLGDAAGESAKVPFVGPVPRGSLFRSRRPRAVGLLNGLLLYTCIVNYYHLSSGTKHRTTKGEMGNL